MRCIVRSCKNDSRHISKTEGVTYHVFPTEPLIQDSWLKALADEKLIPDENSVVCSQHFLHNDFYWTDNGLRMVKAGAIPTVLLVCRICLATDIKLLCMRKYQLGEAYQHLTGLLISEDTFPHYLCVECAYRLLNFAKLRTKSLQAYSLMCEIVKKKQSLSAESIKAINRERYQLSSQMANKVFEPNHADLCVEDQIVKGGLNNKMFLNKSSDDFQECRMEEQFDVNEDMESCSEVANLMNEDDRDVDTKKIINNQSITKINSKKVLCHNMLKIGFTPFHEKEITSKEIVKTKQRNSVDKNITCELNYDVFPMESDNSVVECKEEFIDDYGSNDSFELTMLKDDDENIVENLMEINTDKDKSVDFTKGDVEIDQDEEVDVLIIRKDYSSDDSYDSEIQKSSEDNKEYSKRVRQHQSIDFEMTSYFTIDTLTKDEQLKELEKRKESPNYKTAPFQCNLCCQIFVHLDTYNNHMIKHTDQCGKHVCDICKVHMRQACMVRIHKKNSHLNRYNCKKCNFVTVHRKAAILHMKWHNGTKYKCEHCNREFARLSTYMSHLRIKHPSDFVCQLCGYSFVGEMGIKIHMKRGHRSEDTEIPADGPYCEECDIRFLNEEALEKHLSVSTKHTDADPDATRRKNSNAYIYGKSYGKRKRMLEKNKIKVKKIEVKKEISLEDAIPCEQCGVQLADYRSYHAHFRRNHPGKTRTKYAPYTYICEICGKIFSGIAHFRYHAAAHTGTKDFKCEICGKEFTTKTCLQNHSRVHNQTKATYMCNVCGKSFTNKGNMHRHMLSHTGHKPYACEKCDKTFMHACEKRYHVEYVHMNKPWPKRVRGKRRKRDSAPEVAASESETTAASASESAIR